MAHNRFVNSALSELQEANRSPIDGYQYLPLLTLEEATENIISSVPAIVDYVSKAKKKCNRSSTLLTRDESAAIYLYSMPASLFSRLNEALRAKDRHELEPWFAFLKLFITAIEKLPSTKAIVWRGVNYDDTVSFVDNDVHVWWNINSCSMNPNVVEGFLGKSGTLFAIDTVHGKDITLFSAIPDEQEVVLMPGTLVRRKYESLNFDDRLFVLHLEEGNTKRLVHMKDN
jgi:hypothetical protein